MVDFLNTYPMSYEEWKNLMDEYVDAVMQSDNPVEDFKLYCQGQYKDYPLLNKEPQENKRSKEYRQEHKQWKKEYNTWNQVLGIAEGCDTRYPVDVLEDMLEEIEGLYNNGRWDKTILLHDVIYMCAVHLEVACKIRLMEQPQYLIEPVFKNQIYIGSDLYKIGDTVDVDENIQLFDDIKIARRNMKGSTVTHRDRIIKCETIACTNNYEPTEIKLLKIINP